MIKKKNVTIGKWEYGTDPAEKREKITNAMVGKSGQSRMKITGSQEGTV